VPTQCRQPLDCLRRSSVGDNIPGYIVTARFRQRRGAERKTLFVAVLRLCREAGLVRLPGWPPFLYARAGTLPRRDMTHRSYTTPWNTIFPLPDNSNQRGHSGLWLDVGQGRP
jgi:hypothetical protein